MTNPLFMRKFIILSGIVSINSAALGQELRAIHPKGYTSSVLYVGDRLHVTVQDSALGRVSYMGQLTKLLTNSLWITGKSGGIHSFPIQRVTGLRKIPSLLTSAGAGLALGATTLTIIDKRNSFSGPRIGLSVLIGTGAGMVVALVQRAFKPKQIRQRISRGWSFQVR